MNSFVSSLYVLLDVIKAFGPMIASGFLGWVAYNQFKLAKSQSKISQKQLALAKQQADIAQKKVELDIRDRKYEVFKRWNEAYNYFISDSYSKKFSDLNRSCGVFFAISDELQVAFDKNSIMEMYLGEVRDWVNKILDIRQKFIYTHSIDVEGFDVNHDMYMVLLKSGYYRLVQSYVEEMNKCRTFVLEEMRKEVQILSVV